jgi:hypothetical protein
VRHQIIRDRQGCWSGANASYSFAILLSWNFGQQMSDIVAEIGCDALQPADGDGLSVYSLAAACGLTGPVARPPKNSRKYV